MSHTHDDRVAQRPGHLCHAYGCPLLGSMSASTSGGSEWWCFAHFGRDAGSLQRITSELHRLDWLANAITDIRGRAHSPDWRATFERIAHDIQLAQRNDLTHQSHESADVWLVRLETALGALVRAEVKPAPKQQKIATSSDTGTFAKVGFELPEPA